MELVYRKNFILAILSFLSCLYYFFIFKSNFLNYSDILVKNNTFSENPLSSFDLTTQSIDSAFFNSTLQFQFTAAKKEVVIRKDNPNKYILDISKERINKLFKKLHEKETKYLSVMKNLNIFLFEDFRQKKYQNNNSKFVNYEINKFLKLNEDKVEVTDNFIKYLHNISSQDSFERSGKHLVKENITKVILILFFRF